MSTIWTMMTGLVLCVVYMFNTFATASDVEEVVVEQTAAVDELKLTINYGQYYDRLDDYDEAMDEDNDRLAKEYKRQLEKLEAKICEADPEWERCKD